MENPENIDKVLEKLIEARKEKGLSQENMASELGISQAAYTNLEKNESKLTIERFLKISSILEKPTYYFVETNPNNSYNQSFTDNAIGGHIENLYQDNKETYAKLSDAYEANIRSLKEEVEFLRGMMK
jgi:transcriptional regulator with XRE-family HTH domain